jgi:hypothetical protein
LCGRSSPAIGLIGAGQNLLSLYSIDIGTVDYYGNTLTNSPVGAYGGAGVAAPVTFTTFNPSDTVNGGGLSNGNKTISYCGSSPVGARNIASISGKKYFEFTVTFTGPDAVNCGIGSASFTLSNGGSSGFGKQYWINDGLYSNGASTITSFGTQTSPVVVCVAVDTTLTKHGSG